MDLKVKAIVLSSKDSGDKDKIVTLFCLDKGILQAKLKSVKSANAKLKFAKEQFCFADFTIASKNDFLTITSSECIDSFYSITQNYDLFLEGSEILKIVKKVAQESQENNLLFINTLKSLSALAYDGVKKDIVLIKFLLGLFYSEGYNFSHDKCTSCQTKLGESRFIDLDTGEVLCAGCKTDFCERISFALSSVLRVINQTDYDRLKTLNLDTTNAENVLSILKKNLIRKS